MSLTASPCSSPGKRPNIAVSVGPGLRVFTRIPRSTSSALRIRARWTTAALQVETVEIVGYHLVEALLCHVFEQQELAVTCIDEDAVQVPELPLDRGEQRVEVGEIADVRAHGETAGSQRLLRRLQRPLIQAADGDARALAVEFLRCGQPDPAVAAGDKDMLVRESTHGRHSFRLHMSVAATFRGN